MRNRLRGILAIAICGFGVTSLAIAQSTNSGDIRGTVTDRTGALVPDATVTVLDNDKGVTKVYHSNKDGLYDTGPIVTGNYRITFEKEGFAPYVRSSVNLQVGIITIDGKLVPGSVTQEVVVTTDVPLIKTESGEQSTVLEAKEMQKRPNVGQDWENFVREIPGATGTTSYGATGQALSINGNLPYNSVMADGASSTLSHSGNADVAIFETVQEVQINTNAFSAQYGIGGAIFNQITKGGTNQFHGTLYEYAQNDAFDARGYFAVPGTTKTYKRYHNFGGSVGGPALKDKLFFFFDYDQTISKNASSGYQTVPTLAMRNGDFSAFLQNGVNNPLYNPNSAVLATYVQSGVTKQAVNRTPITNNDLTTLGPLDPVALNIQKLIPLPNINVPGTTQTGSNGVTGSNYYYNTRGTNPFKKYFGRLDYDLNSHNRVTASVTQHDNPATFPGQFPSVPVVGAYNGDCGRVQLTDHRCVEHQQPDDQRSALRVYEPAQLLHSVEQRNRIRGRPWVFPA